MSHISAPASAAKLGGTHGPKGLEWISAPLFHFSLPSVSSSSSSASPRGMWWCSSVPSFFFFSFFI